MYIYYNQNPQKDVKLDCVARAISLALNINYYDVIYILYNNGYNNCCDGLTVDCYANVLENVFGFKCYNANGKKVREISEDFKDDIVLIRIPNHLTCSILGNVYDIWNCTNEVADRFWVVN